MTSPPTLTTMRALIPEKLHDQLTARIRLDHPEHAHQADRILAQTLAFLLACAANPGLGLAPSKIVDIGWHTLILYTREYAELCQRVAGRMIHHRPDDDTADVETSSPATRVGATVEAMRAAGLPVDVELWIPTSECSQCYAGCVDDPSGG